jgi:hypothetical protein
MRHLPSLKPLSFICLFVFTYTLVNAQSTSNLGCKPPLSRELWHQYIDREQINALRASGGTTSFKNDNEQISYYVTNALVGTIDNLQCQVEKDSTLTDQKKVLYLRGIEKLLRTFTNQYRAHQFNAAHLPDAISAYQVMMEKDKQDEPMNFYVAQLPYEIGKLLVDCGAFERNKGYASAKTELLSKYLISHPEKIFITLKDNPELPIRDSLIVLGGHKFPRQLYDYAAAENKLGFAIRKIEDPFVHTIVEMATSKSGSGQLYFPFLDNILSGKQTMKEIDEVKNDPVKYYKLLVKTKLEYVNRQLEGETITEMSSLEKMLAKKGIETFIKTINDLHESPDAIRFKVLQVLNAQELYFLAIAGETDLYTSSYVKGVYPAMMQKINNRGDSLLLSVGFNHFKKFIKIAAGYNTLSNFLASFPDKDAANTLMTAFVNGLEKTNTLEDGVDVADSYASIMETLKPVADDMLANVRQNYDDNVKRNNKRGMVIYELLYKLFKSSTDSTIDLSKEFNIPPVYNVAYSSLAADSGKVVMQVFFYGDKDGRTNFQNFLPTFPARDWKKTENKYWVTFTSTKGKPVLVFANKPLPEETGEVDKAQDELDKYLEQNNLSPTIVVHRGHSYYAPYTIEQIPSSAKIVFLGSCGGYHLINDVLEHAADAHIIASKQTGRMVINQPFFDLLEEKIRAGSNIDWIPFWKEFEKKSGSEEGFGDYIPPHKNLGAIFIKAYKNAMGENNSDQTATL